MGKIFGVIGGNGVAATNKLLELIEVEYTKKGAIVEGDLYYNFGIYEEIQTKTNGATTSTSYRYVIPLGDASYVGLGCALQDTIAELDKQTDETYDYLDGKIDDTETVIHFKGKVEKMDSKDYGFFKDFMTSGGYSEEEIEKYGSQLYIQIKPMTEGPLIMILGAGLFIIGLILLIVMILKIKKMSAPANMYDGSQADYDQPLQNHADFGTVPDPADYNAMQNPQMTQNPAAPQSPADYSQSPQGPQGPTNF